MVEDVRTNKGIVTHKEVEEKYSSHHISHSPVHMPSTATTATKSQLWEKFKKAIDENNWDNFSEDLKNMALLYFHDTGGQPELMEMLPALTIGPALYFLFYRLTDDLDDKFALCYRKKEGGTSLPIMSTSTVGENLISTLSSIYCMSSCVKDQDMQSSCAMVLEDEFAGLDKKSKEHLELLNNSTAAVYIMGTYKDKLYGESSNDAEVEKEVIEIDKRLQALIEPTDFYRKGLVHLQSRNRLIYPIDNRNANTDDALQLQKFVQEKLQANFKRLQIPARWLAFSFTLRTLGESIVSLNSCISLGKLHNMNPEDTKIALSFFHLRAGILMYFRDIPELQEIVIIDVQLVYDLVTRLIVNCLELEEREGSFKADQCRNTGLFEVSHIGEVCREKNFPQDILISLLIKLNIISSVPGSKPQYLMPCLLTSLTDKELSQMKSEYTNCSISSLLICFKCGFVPVGVFSSLIARLFGLEETMEHDFEINHKSVRKNRIEFFIGVDQDVISFVSNTQYFEVLFKSSENNEERAKPFHEVCRDVKMIIIGALEEVLSRTFVAFNENYEFGFENEEDCSSSNNAHICVVKAKKGSENKAKKMACKICDKRFAMEPRHLVWFDKPIKTPSGSCRIVASEKLAMRNCNKALIDGLASQDIDSIADDLDANNLISRDVYEGLALFKTKKEKARDVVKNVAGKVNANPKTIFIQFIKVLIENQQSDLAKMLEDKYVKNGGDRSSLQQAVQIKLQQAAKSSQMEAEETKYCVLSVEDIKLPDFTLSYLRMLSWTDHGGSHSVDVISSLKNLWKKIGDVLEISSDRLDSIQVENDTQEDRCRRVLQIWIKQDNFRFPPTWQGLLRLLILIKETHLAKTLDTALLSTRH